MKNRIFIFTFLFILKNILIKAQSVDEVAGSYIKIDSSSSKYERDGVWYKDVDTTLLTLNKDMSFTYKWSPLFGPYSLQHIYTTGTWKIANKKVILNSKYQQGEYRVFEDYKKEYGDSLVKIYVQTYDSLFGYFQMQFIGVVHDDTRHRQMIFRDRDYPYNACSATFSLPSVEMIVFYGDFGEMPHYTPKNKKSNFFLMQYNLSTNWDYQYLKDYKVKAKDGKLILGEKEDKIILIKM